MIWKFKKSDSTAPNINTSSSAEPSRAGAEHGTPIAASSKVENQDTAISRPDGSYVIPRDYRISGTIVTHRHVVVEGELCGQALVAPSVHVGAEGRLNTATQAAKVTVSGAVDSPISAREMVEVRKGGVIRNDVEAGELSILPGGLVVGARLSIGPLRG